MVYKFVRKTKQASWTESTMDKAMKKVTEDKESIAAVAKKYEIPYTTLYRHIKSGSTKKKLDHFSTIYSSEQENEPCDYLLKMESVFYGLTRCDILSLVYNYANENKIPHPFKNGNAGKDCLHRFQLRNPSIS